MKGERVKGVGEYGTYLGKTKNRTFPFVLLCARLTQLPSQFRLVQPGDIFQMP